MKPNQFAVHLKHCKSTILQLKKKKRKEKKGKQTKIEDSLGQMLLQLTNIK